MDSRTGFASILIIIGLVGVWALFTGKIQKIAPGLFAGSDATPPATGGAASDAGQAGSGSAGGWSIPGKGSAGGWSDQLPKHAMAINSISLPLGSVNGAAKYQIAIGSDGAKIMPIGDPLGSPTIMQPSGRG